MKRHIPLLLYGLTLCLGVLIGSAFNAWPTVNTVHANARQQATVDRLYAELDSDTNVLHAGSRLLAKVAHLTTPSVVHIQSTRRTPRGARVEETGSGVLVGSDVRSGTFVVTNRHVVASPNTNESPSLQDISIHLNDGRVIHPVDVRTDRDSDVAVLKVSAPDLQAAKWGDSDNIDIGHMVLAMGSPFGLSRSVTLGIISAKGRRSLKLEKGGAVLNQDFLQTDAAINPGNSGGPLIDLHGRVVGINTAIASNSGGNDGIGFSIPSNLARRVAEQLLEHGRVQRAYLGVKLDNSFDDSTARQLKLDRVRGARVVKVLDDTPAHHAKLKFNDVVLSFDGTDIADENHLIHLVSLTPVGQTARLVVFRDGKKINVEVLLVERTETQVRS